MKRTGQLPTDDSITKSTKKARKAEPEPAAPSPRPPGPRLHVFIGFMAESEDNALHVVKWDAASSQEWLKIEAALLSSENPGELVEHFETVAGFDDDTPISQLKREEERADELGVRHIDHNELGDWHHKIYPGTARKRPVHGPIHMAWPVTFGSD